MSDDDVVKAGHAVHAAIERGMSLSEFVKAVSPMLGIVKLPSDVVIDEIDRAMGQHRLTESKTVDARTGLNPHVYTNPPYGDKVEEPDGDGEEDFDDDAGGMTDRRTHRAAESRMLAAVRAGREPCPHPRFDIKGKGDEATASCAWCGVGDTGDDDEPGVVGDEEEEKWNEDDDSLGAQFNSGEAYEADP